MDSCDSEDEWFYDSIRRYEDLLIYEFQGSINCSCLQEEDRLLVACQRIKSNELLELAIADRLLPSEDENIIKNRDFKVLSAGYSQNKVSIIISSSSNVFTSESEGVNLYKLGNSDSDLITFGLSIRKGISHPLLSISKLDGDGSLLSGTHLNDVQSYNFNKETILESPLIVENNCLLKNSKLSYLSGNSTDIYCGLLKTGQLMKSDSRSKVPSFKIKLKTDVETLWYYNVSETGSKFAICNYLGEVNVFDGRNVSKEYFKAAINSEPDCVNYLNGKASFDLTESYLSVSGFEKSIFVYSLSQSDEMIPRFVHDGHKKKARSITDHIWHPTAKNVVFSMDDVGVLQAWKFK